MQQELNAAIRGLSTLFVPGHVIGVTLFLMLAVSLSAAEGSPDQYVRIVDGAIQNIGTEVVDSIQITHTTPRAGRISAGLRGPLDIKPGETFSRFKVEADPVIDAIILRGGAVIGDENATMVKRLRAWEAARRTLGSLDVDDIRDWQNEPEYRAGADTDWHRLFLTQLAKGVNLDDIRSKKAPVVAAAPPKPFLQSVICSPGTVTMGESSSCQITFTAILVKKVSVVVGSNNIFASPTVNAVTVPAGTNTGYFSVLTYTLPEGVDQITATISATGPENTVQTTITVKRDNAGTLTSIHVDGTSGQCSLYEGPPYVGAGCEASKSGPAPVGQSLYVYSPILGFCSAGSMRSSIAFYAESYHTCDYSIWVHVKTGLLFNGFTGLFSEANNAAVTPPLDMNSSGFMDCMNVGYVEPDFSFPCYPGGEPGISVNP